ncbi:aminopeptidase [Alkalicoccus urumqiensis]|uniref:Aminopeptidase n=1 Tax=Alkalicoccus urumqiensis TaxID=1548213 RepID=A0A2P6MGK0_ALKUR|nr:aminopeptidase [Alkalicoccus urumqiensis]PRO65404.1 aminopeptidase [Alkalicoccus urumqiensis]
MKDPRIQKLAETLIHYSTSLKPGEKVLIENFGVQQELVNALVEEAYRADALPFVSLKEHAVNRALLMRATPQQQEKTAEFEAYVMKQMDAYIGLRAGDNINELSDVPSEHMALHQKTVGTEVHRKIRVPSTKWVVLRYPTASMAQLAGTSTEAFEDFYFDVCTLDYSRMDKAMDALAARMEKTDQVQISAPGTDLTFSIKDIPAVKCAGRLNIPDGEVYTAPVKDSVNGTIAYNTVSPYQGSSFENVTFTFQNGKIIDASAGDNTAKLNEILDTDEGARFIGEFAIGVNPYIKHPMQDILFDEKIDGSFHFTPGQAYDNAYNGNDSAVHWDLVHIQREEYGGGDLYFDGELIRRNGRFVPEDLQQLNPEQLTK